MRDTTRGPRRLGAVLDDFKLSTELSRHRHGLLHLAAAAESLGQFERYRRIQLAITALDDAIHPGGVDA